MNQTVVCTFLAYDFNVLQANFFLLSGISMHGAHPSVTKLSNLNAGTKN